MNEQERLINDLVIANRILANEDVVDAYGHVSIRNPKNPNTFFMARSLAPELVTADDIVELDLEGNDETPVPGAFHTRRHTRSTPGRNGRRARACRRDPALRHC
jgi:HCOMODA/2-hydroxy-3-carboxy-muconic semialdehyde decarboxylase